MAKTSVKFIAINFFLRITKVYKTSLYVTRLFFFYKVMVKIITTILSSFVPNSRDDEADIHNPKNYISPWV